MLEITRPRGLLRPFFRLWFDVLVPFAGKVLPGGNVNFNAFRDEMFERYKGLPRDPLDGVVRRHGNRTAHVLGDATSLEELGLNFGAGLTAREVECLIADEWAETADDILYRRTKCGLHMDAAQRAALDAYLRGLPELRR